LKVISDRKFRKVTIEYHKSERDSTLDNIKKVYGDDYITISMGIIPSHSKYYNNDGMCRITFEVEVWLRDLRLPSHVLILKAS